MNSAHPFSPDAGWRRQLAPRLRTLWLAKMLATTLGITAFFVAYFWVLRHPLSDVTIMPLTAVDRLVGFWPQALPLYASLWLYVSLAPALLKNRRELMSYGLATLALSVAGFAVFLVWPTAVPTFQIDWSQHRSIVFLKGADGAANACPSLHVAFAVFTAVWFERLLREMHVSRALRALSWLWCLGILYSTLATLQHVALDVLAGAVLGAVVAVLHLRAHRWLEQRRERRPSYAVNVAEGAQA
jgi:membrane-associated phospholipid phosphatase